MAKVSRFEDLEIAVQVTGLFESAKLNRDFEIKNQAVRAAMSISNNIAEGFEYDNRKDFIRFLRIAKGSAGETRSMYFLLLRTGKISQQTFDSMYDALILESRKIKTLITYLSNKPDKPLK